MAVGGYLSGISMRGRMTILIATAMLPLAVFLGFSIVADYESTLFGARRELLQSANLAASRQSQLFATSRILLDTVRRAVGVTVAGGSACEQILASVKEANPQFLSVGVTDGDGTITCHSSLRKRQAFPEITLIQKITAPNAPDFIVGNFMIGEAIKKPTVALAVPMKDYFGRKVGAVFASINLERLSQAAESVSFGGPRSITIVQPESGRVLTQYPKGNFPAGTIFADHPLIEAMRKAPAGGVTEGKGFVEVDNIFGFVPIEGAETAGMMLAVGEVKATLLSPVETDAIWRIAAGAGVFAVAIAAAWWLGDRLQLRPIARLTHIAVRIGAGDFEARTRIESWQAPELCALAATLDHMADRLAAGRAAEQIVDASRKRYRLLADNMADLVTCVGPNGRRIFASPSSVEMLGYEPDQMLALQPMDMIHPDDTGIVARMMATLNEGRPMTGIQYRMRHRAGHYVWVEVNGRPTDVERQIVFSIRDITQRKKMEDDLAEANRQLSALASTDALTGLLNRRSFDVTLADAFDLARVNGRDLSLLMIDVDRFKAFNDRYGHPAGDDCLRRVAVELRAILRRPGIYLARYGGEEFAVVLPETPLSSALQEAEALRFALHRMEIRHEGSEYGVVTISVGVATLSGGHGAADAVDLVRKADGALYAAKHAGRNRTEIGVAALARVS